MCTVLVRVAPGEPWPLLLGAVRDEFVDRPWDPPDRHWDGAWAGLVGGRDRAAGGTWLAVDPDRPAVAALLNGFRREPPSPEEGPRPTRGTLALEILASGDLPPVLDRYDRFHLLLGSGSGAHVWTWDGEALVEAELEPGTHLVVNAGLDAYEDPLVPHFEPLLAGLPKPDDDLGPAWDAWRDLLLGDGLPMDDERALLVRKEIEGRTYGSTSASLVALGAEGLRYEFTAHPTTPAWEPVRIGRPSSAARPD